MFSTFEIIFERQYVYQWDQFGGKYWLLSNSIRDSFNKASEKDFSI